MIPIRYSVKEGLALIFDLDGVVIHSMPVHTEAWEIYLQRHGIRQECVEQRMHGRHNDEIVRDFFGEGLSDEEVFAHGAAKEELFRELMRPRLMEHLVAGIAGFLQRHQERRLGLATNAESANASFVLEGSGLRSCFRAIVNGHQVTRPKPFPDIYLRAAELLGVRPQNCVIFEDSDTGVEAARAAGAHVVGVTTTSPDLTGVDLRIDNFLNPRLEPWLEQLQPRG